MKFSGNVLQVNTHQLTELDFRFDVKHTGRRPYRNFAQKSAAIWMIWWVRTQRLPGAYAPASASSRSIVHSYLLFVYFIVCLCTVHRALLSHWW